MLNDCEFKKIYSMVPRVCVDLLLMEGDSFLLTRRKIIPDKGKWHLPGGTIFFQESVNQAIKRIAKSELGLDIEIVKQVGIAEFLRKQSHECTMIFLVKGKHENIKLDFQADKFKFFKKIPKNIMEPHAKFLEGYLNV